MHRRLFLQFLGTGAAQAAGLPSAGSLATKTVTSTLSSLATSEIVTIPDAAAIADGYRSMTGWLQANATRAAGLEHILIGKDDEGSRNLLPYLQMAARIRDYGKNNILSDDSLKNNKIRAAINAIELAELKAYEDVARKLADACFKSPSFIKTINSEFKPGMPVEEELKISLAKSSVRVIEQEIKNLTNADYQATTFDSKDSTIECLLHHTQDWLSEGVGDKIVEDARKQVRERINKTSREFGIKPESIAEFLSLTSSRDFSGFLKAPGLMGDEYKSTLADMLDDKKLFAHLANVVTEAINSHIIGQWSEISGYGSSKPAATDAILDGRFEAALQSRYKKAFAKAFPDVRADTVPLPLIKGDTKSYIANELKIYEDRIERDKDWANMHRNLPATSSIAEKDNVSLPHGGITAIAKIIQEGKKWVDSVPPAEASAANTAASTAAHTPETPALPEPEKKPGTPLGAFTQKEGVRTGNTDPLRHR